MLPKGWLSTDLHDFISIKHGFAFKSDFFEESGEFVLLTPGSFYEFGGFRHQGHKTKFYVGNIPAGYILSKNDLLLAMTEQAAGLLGSALLVPENNKYLHNQRLGLVKIKEKEKLCAEFLYLLYNSPLVRKQIAEQSTGTKVKHTSPDKLRSVVCLLPPLSEQRKIAQILSTWDKSIVTTEKLIAASQQQKKALMQQLLTGKKRFAGFSDEWSFLTFEDSFKVANNKSAQVKSPDYLDSGRVPIVDQGQKLIAGYCNSENAYSDVPVIVFGDHTRCLKWIDFVFCPGADGTQILKTKDHIDKKFSYYMICNIEIPNLGYSRHMRELKQKDFKVPSEIKEQQKIAAVLTAADQEIDALQSKLAHLKQEKKALMQQLLTGKRRVVLEAETSH
jgi:type I restriction enzyme S subunit